MDSSAFPKAKRHTSRSVHTLSPPLMSVCSSCILVLSTLSIYRGNWTNPILPLCYFVLSSSGNMLSQQRHSAEPCQIPFSAGCLEVNCMWKAGRVVFPKALSSGFVMLGKRLDAKVQHSDRRPETFTPSLNSPVYSTLHSRCMVCALFFESFPWGFRGAERGFGYVRNKK